jgi:uncharacterized membrane protein YczE
MLPRRLLQLYGGLALYGASAGLILIAAYGADPWDVFHQGLSRQTGIGTGIWVCIVGALVLLLWIPLRQKPGLGTVSNVIVVGLAIELMLRVFDTPAAPVARGCLLAAGIVLNGVATGLYIGARFGPGPRDGLMTGLVARTGRSIRLIRTGLEAAVVLSGWLLGGTLGIGTLLFAVTIGPLVQLFLPRLTVRPAEPAASPTEPEAAAATVPEPAPAPRPATA